jgi:hypothetical protein
MLTEAERLQVWEHLLASETRALYFADLTRRTTRHKQIITGASFFLSSGAAAAIIGRAPSWVPIGCALVVAAATAYAIAANLDGRIATVAKLHATWGQIAMLYDRLWQHLEAPDGDRQLQHLIEREREPSELAAAGAPYDKRLLAQWQTYVFQMYHLESPA